MFRLDGKTAIVTGGGSGIGRAIASLFGKQGAEVCILDYDETAATNVADEIKSNGGRAHGIKCDVSNHELVHSIVQAIIKNFSYVDILVNNAGVAHIGTAENTKEEDFDRLFNVNVKGVYNCIHAAIPLLKKAGGGCIINMASIAALVGIPDRFVYSTAKGAVMAMTLSVAKDYLQENIRCNSISPARVHTPFVDGFLKNNYPGKEEEMFDKLSKTQPIGRMGTTEEIAALALYLCSDEASFITGCDYLIDGGFVKLNN